MIVTSTAAAPVDSAVTTASPSAASLHWDTEVPTNNIHRPTQGSHQYITCRHSALHSRHNSTTSGRGTVQPSSSSASIRINNGAVSQHPRLSRRSQRQNRRDQLPTTTRGGTSERCRGRHAALIQHLSRSVAQSAKRPHSASPHQS